MDAHDSFTSKSSTTSEESEARISPILQQIVPNTQVAELQAKLNRCKRLYVREKIKAARYKKVVRNTRNKLNRKEIAPDVTQSELLKEIFNSDQILALKKKKMKKTTKLMKWTNNTVTKSLKLKFSCGASGYNELLTQGYPLPSIRTLQRRLQNLKFDCGILNEVFSFLKLKVETFSPYEKDCALVLDEMAITPGKIYDTSLGKYFGEVTLPGHSGQATHVLVFMLAGITSRWKQVVAYYFTSDSVNGAVFKNIIVDIFRKAEALGLNILTVTSDMGPCNQALWREWGIKAGRYSVIKSEIDHPLSLEKTVYVFADVPHLFKNIKSMLITNKIIELPHNLVQQYNLPTNQVMSSHISDLVKHQDKNLFKLAPKLSEEDLLPSHFAKMKVSTSTNVVSHSVSSALKFLADEFKTPEYLTTAWFLDQIEKWFYLMTSRHPTSALSQLNKEIYNDTIIFLQEFINIFTYMEVGYKKIWKPCQTGVLISTHSVLKLQSELLENKKYQFILTSRFSQDCLENLFCVMRSKQIVPNAVQVKNNLKLICVSQYLKNATTSSYDDDDREFLSGFLDTLETNIPRYDEVILPSETKSAVFNLNYSELNSLYNISGYILRSIVKTSKTCSNCVSAAGSTKPIYQKFSKLTLIKRFKEQSLYFTTELVFYFFLDMENVFRNYFDIISSQNIDIKEFYCKEMSNLKIDLPDCHNLKSKIIKRFIVFRLKISSKKCKAAAKKQSSKSLAGSLL